jgi:spore maturation protein CgeB
MKIVFFGRSLLSEFGDEVHFLRGIAGELSERGSEVIFYEPKQAPGAESNGATGRLLQKLYPTLRVEPFDPATFDPAEAVDRASLVLVHELSEPAVVSALGKLRLKSRGWELFFHDTHRAGLSEKGAPWPDLTGYDGILAGAEALRERYVGAGWARRAFTWHEAADVRIWKPEREPESGVRATALADVIWEEPESGDSSSELWREFLVRPLSALRLGASAFGARYSSAAILELKRAGIDYLGVLPNHQMPEVFRRHRVALHVPSLRTRDLPGMPSIRFFEALACGVPLVSAPWDDAEDLFRRGDYVTARGCEQMKATLRDLVCNPALRDAIASRGLETVLARHTCAHRADELLSIWGRFQGVRTPAPPHPTALVEAS